jgi:hypothetical protein
VGDDGLFRPGRTLRRRAGVEHPCERCGNRSGWIVRGRRKRFDELGQVTPAAPWGEWHKLCGACLEPVKDELQLAELLELQVQPIDPHHRSFGLVAMPGGR